MSPIAQADLSYRWATKADAEAVVPLMHTSSKAMIDYSFGVGRRPPVDFVHRAFVAGRGVFGYPHQFVAVDPLGVVVATTTAYRGERATRLTLETVPVAFWHYGIFDFIEVLRRSFAMAPLFIRPSAGAVFLANACVVATRRGAGVYGALLDALQRDSAIGAGAPFELDVSFSNTPAQRAYERLGFAVVAERPYHGTRPIEGFRRMRRG